jgi:hypothetical protein
MEPIPFYNCGPRGRRRHSGRRPLGEREARWCIGDTNEAKLLLSASSPRTLREGPHLRTVCGSYEPTGFLDIAIEVCVHGGV